MSGEQTRARQESYRRDRAALWRTQAPNAVSTFSKARRQRGGRTLSGRNGDFPRRRRGEAFARLRPGRLGRPRSGAATSRPLASLGWRRQSVAAAYWSSVFLAGEAVHRQLRGTAPKRPSWRVLSSVKLFICCRHRSTPLCCGRVVDDEQANPARANQVPKCRPVVRHRASQESVEGYDMRRRTTKSRIA
jgi:hypothetical protein